MVKGSQASRRINTRRRVESLQSNKKSNRKKQNRQKTQGRKLKLSSSLNLTKKHSSSPKKGGQVQRVQPPKRDTRTKKQITVAPTIEDRYKVKPVVVALSPISLTSAWQTVLLNKIPIELKKLGGKEDCFKVILKDKSSEGHSEMSAKCHDNNTRPRKPQLARKSTTKPPGFEAKLQQLKRQASSDSSPSSAPVSKQGRKSTNSPIVGAVKLNIKTNTVEIPTPKATDKGGSVLVQKEKIANGDLNRKAEFQTNGNACLVGKNKDQKSAPTDDSSKSNSVDCSRETRSSTRSQNTSVHPTVRKLRQSKSRSPSPSSGNHTNSTTSSRNSSPKRASTDSDSDGDKSVNGKAESGTRKSTRNTSSPYRRTRQDRDTTCETNYVPEIKKQEKLTDGKDLKQNKNKQTEQNSKESSKQTPEMVQLEGKNVKGPNTTETQKNATSTTQREVTIKVEPDTIRIKKTVYINPVKLNSVVSKALAKRNEDISKKDRASESRNSQGVISEPLNLTMNDKTHQHGSQQENIVVEQTETPTKASPMSNSLSSSNTKISPEIPKLSPEVTKLSPDATNLTPEITKTIPEVKDKESVSNDSVDSGALESGTKPIIDANETVESGTKPNIDAHETVEGGTKPNIDAHETVESGTKPNIDAHETDGSGDKEVSQDDDKQKDNSHSRDNHMETETDKVSTDNQSKNNNQDSSTEEKVSEGRSENEESIETEEPKIVSTDTTKEISAEQVEDVNMAESKMEEEVPMETDQGKVEKVVAMETEESQAEEVMAMTPDEHRLEEVAVTKTEEGSKKKVVATVIEESKGVPMITKEPGDEKECVQSVEKTDNKSADMTAAEDKQCEQSTDSDKVDKTNLPGGLNKDSLVLERQNKDSSTQEFENKEIKDLTVKTIESTTKNETSSISMTDDKKVIVQTEDYSGKSETNVRATVACKRPSSPQRDEGDRQVKKPKLEDTNISIDVKTKDETDTKADNDMKEDYLRKVPDTGMINLELSKKELGILVAKAFEEKRREDQATIASLRQKVARLQEQNKIWEQRVKQFRQTTEVMVKDQNRNHIKALMSKRQQPKESGVSIGVQTDSPTIHTHTTDSISVVDSHRPQTVQVTQGSVQPAVPIRAAAPMQPKQASVSTSSPTVPEASPPSAAAAKPAASVQIISTSTAALTSPVVGASSSITQSKPDSGTKTVSMPAPSLLQPQPGVSQSFSAANVRQAAPAIQILSTTPAALTSPVVGASTSITQSKPDSGTKTVSMPALSLLQPTQPGVSQNSQVKPGSTTAAPVTIIPAKPTVVPQSKEGNTPTPMQLNVVQDRSSSPPVQVTGVHTKARPGTQKPTVLIDLTDDDDNNQSKSSNTAVTPLRDSPNQQTIPKPMQQKQPTPEQQKQQLLQQRMQQRQALLQQQQQQQQQTQQQTQQQVVRTSPKNTGMPRFSLQQNQGAHQVGPPALSAAARPPPTYQVQAPVSVSSAPVVSQSLVNRTPITSNNTVRPIAVNENIIHSQLMQQQQARPTAISSQQVGGQIGQQPLLVNMVSRMPMPVTTNVSSGITLQQLATLGTRPISSVQVVQPQQHNSSGMTLVSQPRAPMALPITMSQIQQPRPPPLQVTTTLASTLQPQQQLTQGMPPRLQGPHITIQGQRISTSVSQGLPNFGVQQTIPTQTISLQQTRPALNQQPPPLAPIQNTLLPSTSTAPQNVTIDNIRMLKEHQRRLSQHKNELINKRNQNPNMRELQPQIQAVMLQEQKVIEELATAERVHMQRVVAQQRQLQQQHLQTQSQAIIEHPAPLPVLPSPARTILPHQMKQALPGKPSLKISKVNNGIVLSWTMSIDPSWATIDTYLLYAYQESEGSPSTALWKKIGDVRALPLPMACTLTQFQPGSIYHFAVCAIDIYQRPGSFSDPASIDLNIPRT